MLFGPGDGLLGSVGGRGGGCKGAPPARATPLLRFGLPSLRDVVGMVLAPGSASRKHPFCVVCVRVALVVMCAGCGVGVWGCGPLMMLCVCALFVGGGVGQSMPCGDVQSSGGGGGQVGQEWVRKRGNKEHQRIGGGATQPHRMREPHQEGRGRVQRTRRRGAARQGRQPGQRE